MLLPPSLRLPTLFLLASLAGVGGAIAGGGPRNVLVVLNEASEESLEIGTYYAQARDIPAANICRITVTTALTATKAEYQDDMETPIEQCIANSPYASRIDYIVLTRGMPIRASFPGGRVSTAALLQAFDTDLRDKDQEYAEPYGFQNYPNPYRGRDEYFSHAKTFGFPPRQLYIVTMLSGYWSEDALSLVDLSLASDGNPPSDAGGVFYLEETTNPASPANTRNAQCGPAATNLEASGYTAVHVTGPDPNVTDSIVASHVNAGSYSSINRAAIDSNTYPPGALVDVLESFGLVPENFDPDHGGRQVPVTWWVSAGMTGAHGTVSEPYNVAFPSAYLLEPYVAGYNLGETFYQGIPFLYWMNLVLGDPLAAPYATAIQVDITSPADGATVTLGTSFNATGNTTAPAGVGRMELFIDDELLHEADRDNIGFLPNTMSLADGWHRLDALAYEGSKYWTQATASVEFYINNHGLSATISDPPADTVVSGMFSVTIETSPTVTEVSLSSEGLALGSVTGTSPFVLDVDSSLLGRGRNTLRATGSDGVDMVIARPVDILVAKAPRLHDLSPIEGPSSGGTTVLLRGWNFEPDTRVFFDGMEALVDRLDANHVEATTPPGSGLVAVRIESQGLSLDLADAYTYICATDADMDLSCDEVDNCLGVPNPEQLNSDNDSFGDDCDNCPDRDNEDQLDSDGNGIGDACEGCAVSSSPTTLMLSQDGVQVSLTWQDLPDPCLDSYIMRQGLLPVGAWTDVTALDEDGNIGGDAYYLTSLDATNLLYFDVVGLGTDGELGPR